MGRRLNMKKENHKLDNGMQSLLVSLSIQSVKIIRPYQFSY